MALVRKLNRRKGLRSRLTELINEAKQSLEEEQVTLPRLSGLKSNIDKTVQRIQILDDEVLNGIDSDSVEMRLWKV